MKAVFEVWHGVTYLYMEDERHHKVAQLSRKTPLLDALDLNEDCQILNRGDFHVIFDIAKKPARKRRKAIA